MDATMNNKVSASIAYPMPGAPTGFSHGKEPDQGLMFHPQMELASEKYESTNPTKAYRHTIHTQPTRLWSSANMAHGLEPSPTITSSVSATSRTEHQALQLPNFMANTLYTPNGKPPMQTAPAGQKTQYFSTNFAGRKLGREPLGSPSQFVNYGGQSTAHSNANFQKKAPAAPLSNSSDFGSVITNASNFDTRSDGADSRSNTISSADHRSSNYGSMQSSEATENEAVEVLKLELLFKNQINKSLNDKLSLLKTESVERKSGEATAADQVKLPNNYYQLFRDLTRTLNERTKELEETKARIEAIIVGLVMTKDPAITTNGLFDAQELAHRITNKLAVLQSENEALLDMVSHSNKQSLLIELGLMKSENKVLRDKLKELGQE